MRRELWPAEALVILRLYEREFFCVFHVLCVPLIIMRGYKWTPLSSLERATVLFYYLNLKIIILMKLKWFVL